MTRFRRRRRDEPGSPGWPGQPPGPPPGRPPGDPADHVDEQVAPAPTRGPWDASEVVLGDDLVDLGGLLVPAQPGMQLRAEVADDRVLAVSMILGGSALQVQPYAAPRTLGIWEEVRSEIAAGITQQGGLVDEVEGPFGPELQAQVPVQLPGGRRGMQAARYLGVDGPRWFLRGVITGAAAAQPGSAAPIEDVFARLVVVRGSDPMAPRDPIPLRRPQQLGGPPDVPADHDVAPGPRRDDLNPFRRGPEITEIR
jgi:Protein of unknown function (DUF3710)